MKKKSPKWLLRKRPVVPWVKSLERIVVIEFLRRCTSFVKMGSSLCDNRRFKSGRHLSITLQGLVSTFLQVRQENKIIIGLASFLVREILPALVNQVITLMADEDFEQQEVRFILPAIRVCTLSNLYIRLLGERLRSCAASLAKGSSERLLLSLRAKFLQQIPALEKACA